jgi:hypothetical protein
MSRDTALPKSSFRIQGYWKQVLHNSEMLYIDFLTITMIAHMCKVKLSLCLSNYQYAVGEWIYRSIFLDLGISWMWVVSFTSLLRYPRERAFCTHSIGGLVGPRAGMDELEKRKSWPYCDSNSDPLVVQSVASRYTDCAIPAPMLCIWESKKKRKERKWLNLGSDLWVEDMWGPQVKQQFTSKDPFHEGRSDRKKGKTLTGAESERRISGGLGSRRKRRWKGKTSTERHSHAFSYTTDLDYVS